MSALTLLSVIAPVVPIAPQGPSGEAVSGFRDLLAALSGEDPAAPVAKNPAEPRTLDEAEVEAEVGASVVAGFLAAPLVLPVAEEASSTTGAESGGDQPDEAGADAVLLRLAPVGAATDPDGTQATTPLTLDKVPTPKTNGPEVQPREQTTTPPLTVEGLTTGPPGPEVLPPLPAGRPLTGETSDTALTLAETAAATEAVEAHVRTGATPAPSSSPPAATPPPLRPLAERSSRSPGPPDAGTGDGTRSVDPVRPVRASANATPAVAANPAAGPADLAAAAAAAARDVANGDETERTPSESSAPVESAPGQSQTQAAVGPRETGVSQLSRATIEATAQIAAQILRRLEGRSTRFEMALTPDELGRVDVKLDIDSEGRLNARLAFDNPLAATDFRGRADELRRQLEEAGFHLAEDAFEFAERDSGSSAFDRGQDARNGSSRAFAATSRLNAEIDVAQPRRWMALTLSPSGVDMKV
ncbi:flagellar hook-length control protein FliK [Brevundimonas sp.]|uniref:flagellar hook-length control protein FliK n=1 Tax=Brevundimonas sp. TaxID=1871086 RepID=UPI002731AC3F|nr:flagellar hook-length control protein FliK [Brevundimonas sp.]MDP1914274.1 flagellar hook-length control protein FliK [Brevundimonas sp.]